jgi:hypothetical protein
MVEDLLSPKAGFHERRGFLRFQIDTLEILISEPCRGQDDGKWMELLGELFSSTEVICVTAAETTEQRDMRFKDRSAELTSQVAYRRRESLISFP